MSVSIKKALVLTLLVAADFFVPLNDRVKKAPPRAEGEGPFPQLIVRGVTLINGNGAPPIGWAEPAPPGG